MRPMQSLAARLLPVLRDRRGATAVEYGLMLALIVLMMLVGFSGFASEAIEIWNTIADKVVTLSR